MERTTVLSEIKRHDGRAGPCLRGGLLREGGGRAIGHLVLRRGGGGQANKTRRLLARKFKLGIFRLAHYHLWSPELVWKQRYNLGNGMRGCRGSQFRGHTLGPGEIIPESASAAPPLPNPSFVKVAPLPKSAF